MFKLAGLLICLNLVGIMMNWCVQVFFYIYKVLYFAENMYYFNICYFTVDLSVFFSLLCRALLFFLLTLVSILLLFFFV